MKHVTRTGALAVAALVVATGCATKNWVRDEMNKRDAEMNQRIVKVDDRVGEESQRVDKRVEVVDKRVDGVETRVGQESQRIEGINTRVGNVETAMTSTSDAVSIARRSTCSRLAATSSISTIRTTSSRSRRI